MLQDTEDVVAQFVHIQLLSRMKGEIIGQWSKRQIRVAHSHLEKGQKPP